MQEWFAELPRAHIAEEGALVFQQDQDPAVGAEDRSFTNPVLREIGGLPVLEIPAGPGTL
jgi:hypothetical protein